MENRYRYISAMFNNNNTPAESLKEGVKAVTQKLLQAPLLQQYTELLSEIEARFEEWTQSNISGLSINSIQEDTKISYQTPDSLDFKVNHLFFKLGEHTFHLCVGERTNPQPFSAKYGYMYHVESNV